MSSLHGLRGYRDRERVQGFKFWMPQPCWRLTCGYDQIRMRDVSPQCQSGSVNITLPCGDRESLYPPPPPRPAFPPPPPRPEVGIIVINPHSISPGLLDRIESRVVAMYSAGFKIHAKRQSRHFCVDQPLQRWIIFVRTMETKGYFNLKSS